VRGGHGRVDLESSLEESCDVYYYLLGQKLGIEGIAKWMHRFGFGNRSGLGLSPEAPGLIGTPEWSRRVRGTPWYPGEAVSVSIGQGPFLVTVVQLARAFASLANGGELVTPHLVSARDLLSADLGLDREALARVNRGLERAVHGTHGTARRLSSLPAAGKTGTAQVARLQEGMKVEDLPQHLRHHAWFVGWAPINNPELVVAVIVEHGGGGGRAAVPAATEIFRSYLSSRITAAGREGDGAGAGIPEG
jgi:penicillin-binding protein 2